MDDGKKPANSAAAWPEGFCLKSFRHFSDQVGEKASLRTSGGYCLFFLSTKRRLRKSRKCLRRKGNGRRRGKHRYVISLFQSTQRTQRCCQRNSVWFFFIFRAFWVDQSDNYLLSEWPFDWSAGSLILLVSQRETPKPQSSAKEDTHKVFKGQETLWAT